METTQDKLLFNRQYLQQLLTRPDVYATTLLVLMLDRYGTEMLEWHPQTLRLEIQDDFDVQLPAQNLHKLLAAITILTTDRFEQSLPSFIWLCNVLADDTLDPTVFDIATVDEMAWGITEALLINPPETDNHFCDEIRWYIGHMLDEEGVVDPPDVLRIAVRERTTDPLNDFTDDPEMYSALYQSQQAKSGDIKQMIREHLTEMIKQIESLPLENGNAKDLLRRTREGTA